MAAGAGCWGAVLPLNAVEVERRRKATAGAAGGASIRGVRGHERGRGEGDLEEIKWGATDEVPVLRDRGAVWSTRDPPWELAEVATYLAVGGAKGENVV